MIRLDRLLATLAIGSRTEVGAMIRKGRVTVDGAAVRDPGAQTAETAAITLDGALLDTRLQRHVMLYKPAGVLTAACDKKQPTVMNLLPPVYTAIGCMPVGRLDKDTTGLLLLTTDGELNHRLLAPGRHVDKVYLATVDAPLSAQHVKAFAAGLDLGDFTAAPALLDIAADDPCKARVTVHEGKFHQVKRMFEAVNRTVQTLHRERFGPLTLDAALGPGQWRELTEDELAALRGAVR